jgi:hypothetical protein
MKIYGLNGEIFNSEEDWYDYYRDLIKILEVQYDDPIFDDLKDLDNRIDEYYTENC